MFSAPLDEGWSSAARRLEKDLEKTCRAERHVKKSAFVSQLWTYPGGLGERRHVKSRYMKTLAAILGFVFIF